MGHFPLVTIDSMLNFNGDFNSGDSDVTESFGMNKSYTAHYSRTELTQSVHLE